MNRPEPKAELLHWQDEWEPGSPTGMPVSVRTLFLRGSQCRFQCTMCDLWQYTHTSATPPGNIAAQVQQGLAISRSTPHPIQWLKLYNAANFFDSHNVPVSDLPLIAAATHGLDRVIVENHPRVLPWRIIEEFRDALRPARLEIAIGLETIHPEQFRHLNKGAMLPQIESTIAELLHREIDVRAFVLLGLPDLLEADALLWCQRSIDWAIQRSVRHVSAIPLRAGVGLMHQLREAGRVFEPSAYSLEALLADNLSRAAGVVTVDLWDWQRLRGTCPQCSQARYDRLAHMNLHRVHLPSIRCEHCDANK